MEKIIGFGEKGYMERDNKFLKSVDTGKDNKNFKEKWIWELIISFIDK